MPRRGSLCHGPAIVMAGLHLDPEWQCQWKLKNTPNWIVGWPQLQKQSIKNQMRWKNKSYTNWVDVYLHFMLVVEVIRLNRILDLLVTLDATYCSSNRFMDWHKYPKSRTSIRIQQPETLDSIKCHTFPGMGGKTLDILLHNSALQFFLCQRF